MVIANPTVATPAIDKMLQTFTLKTKEGILLNDVITQGQKEIGECILQRKSPDGKKRIHVMAHTRYGKSLIVGAAVAIRASAKGEPWAIIAPTKEQAQIIMDYVIYFAVNDPIISQTLKTNAKVLKQEQMTQRRSRDHITFLSGGEVRTFSAGQTMGHGAPNVILDEAGLVDDSEEAKVYRMIGDSTDNFIMKIGNPWENNHFKDSFVDPTYYHINIDIHRGIKEGRVTAEHHDAVKKKPHYGVLYLNQFPDDEAKDKWGYLPLFTHRLISNAQLERESMEHLGAKKLGGDGADGGANMSAIVLRSSNLAEVAFTTYNMRSGDFGTKIAEYRDEVESLNVDGLPPGNECVGRLRAAKETKRKLVEINAGKPVLQEWLDDYENAKEFFNLRAYMFWRAAQWLKAGGRLVRHEDWKMLLSVKYKTVNGKMQIVSKEELRKKYKIDDLGVADAFSFTFMPATPEEDWNPPLDSNGEIDVGGIEPLDEILGI